MSSIEKIISSVRDFPQEHEGNPFYPLPPDYASLTEDGRRQARINACRLWLLPGPPSELGRRRIISTWFFDQYYLWPRLAEDPSIFSTQTDFDSGFYDQPPFDSPEGHWAMSRMFATSRLNVIMCPRGFAKTTHLRKDSLLLLISHPSYSIVYGTNNGKNAAKTGQMCSDMCYRNQRISDDWAPLYGRLKPSRGTAPQGAEEFKLSNGSWMQMVSAESRIRGMRPRRFRVDDPENDEKGETSIDLIRAYMEVFLFRKVIPMVLRPGTGVDWAGTFISPRHFAWHAMQVDAITDPSNPDAPPTYRARDSRFSSWSRLFIPAATRAPDGSLVSCWETCWPATEADKARVEAETGRTGLVSLEEQRKILGEAAFEAEMMGNPGGSDDQFFRLSEDPRGPHSWWLEGANADASLLSPHDAHDTFICWYTKDTPTLNRVPLPEFLSTCLLFIAVDSAYTTSATSDRRVVHLMARLPDDTRFSLYLWSGRCSDENLANRAFQVAALWGCPRIYVETIKQTFKLYVRMDSMTVTGASQDAAPGPRHNCRVLPLKPGYMSKVSKIETLDVLFTSSLLKLPHFLRHTSASYSRLFSQIISFNPASEKDGGLEKDDEIDTLAMQLFIIQRGRRDFSWEKAPTTTDIDIVAQLQKDPFADVVPGRSLLSSIPFTSVPSSVIGQALSRHESKTPARPRI